MADFLADSWPIWAIGVIVIGLALRWGWAEDSSLADYRQRCIASGMTAQQCDVLVEAKQSADAAQATASFAIGFTAGSIGSRR